MAWRDSLQPAIFRGVPFFVDSHEASGGRKAVVFELPGADAAFVEDLGRKVHRYELEAYILGPDYFAQRDQFQEALELSGPGTLIHPYLGTKLVLVDRWHLKETRAEGGVARFGIDCIETEPFPISPDGLSAGSALDGSSDQALTSLQNGYVNGSQFQLPANGLSLSPFAAPTSNFSIPGFSLTSVSQILTDWTTTVRNTLAPVMHDTQALATMKSQLNAIVLASGTLVRTPLALATQLGLVLTSMLNWPDTPRLGVTAMLAAFGFKTSAVLPAPTTPTRLVERTNGEALLTYLQGVTAVQAARFAITAITEPGRTISTARRSTDVDPPAGYDSYQDAIAVRNAITSALDSVSETASDDVFAALLQVRADLAAAVPGTPNTLPQLVPFTPLVTTPALVLAQRLYGGLDLVDDIIARNGIAHPGFVAGGVPLQVLSNV